MSDKHTLEKDVIELQSELVYELQISKTGSRIALKNASSEDYLACLLLSKSLIEAQLEYYNKPKNKKAISKTEKENFKRTRHTLELIIKGVQTQLCEKHGLMEPEKSKIIPVVAASDLPKPKGEA